MNKIKQCECLDPMVSANSFCAVCGKPYYIPTDADNEKPLTDEEWINQYIDREVAENDGSYWGWNSDQIADARIHMTVALAEGRKREREGAIREIINRGAKELAREIEPIIQQREEAAAREAWREAYARYREECCDVNELTDFRAWFSARKQRKSQGGIGV